MSVKELKEYILYFILGSFLVVPILMSVFDVVSVEGWYFPYTALALAYVWFNFILLAIGDYKKRNWYAEGTFMVIVPCFNEKPELITRSLDSLLNAKGNKMVVVVDDGSTNGIVETIKRYEDRGVRLLIQRRNQGKRHALHRAVKEYAKEFDYVVLVDSDTIVEPDAFIHLIKPFSDPKVGAVSGDVKLLNEKENWLTRIIDAYYLTGLHIRRKAQSTLGMVSCCSGALAAYRSSVIQKLVDPLINQTLFGQKCSYGDDRHLTLLVLEHRYDAVFEPKAVCYTNTPSTPKTFFRQQLRWGRSFPQETLYMMPFMWKRKPLLWFETVWWDTLASFLAVGLMASLLLQIVTDPAYLLYPFLPAFTFMVIVKSLPIIWERPRKTLSIVTFGFVWMFTLYWVRLYGFLTLRNKGWVTR